MAEPNLQFSGIYAIRHIESGRVYVGSAMSLHKRIYEHRRLLRRGAHRSPLLQRFWAKYGEDAFSFTVLEAVPDIKNLLPREQYWIDALDAASKDTGFNINPTAGSNLGRKFPSRVTSPETRAKMSAAKMGHSVSEQARAKLRAANLGKIHTEESKEKRRIANVGKKMSPEAIAKTAAFWRGRHHSEESKLKISASAKLRPKRPAEFYARIGSMNTKPKTPEHRAAISRGRIAMFAARRAKQGS